MNIVETLQKVGAAVFENFPDINRGGCCVYAAAVAAALQPKMPVRIRAYNWDALEDTRLEVLKQENPGNTMSQWYSLGLDFYHLVLEFEAEGQAYHCDAETVLPAEAMHAKIGGTLLEGSFTVEEAQVLADDASGWNPTFDRNVIPDVHALIASQLTSFNPS